MKLLKHYYFENQNIGFSTQTVAMQTILQVGLYTLGTHHLISGGGARVFVACKLFFLPPVENKLFFGDQRPTIFFLCYVEEIFCRMLSLLCRLRYHLVFFLVNIFFINFDNKLFFSAHIFNKLFFLTFVATNYFFNFNLASPPPPRYQMVRPLSNVTFRRYDNTDCGSTGSGRSRA